MPSPLFRFQSRPLCHALLSCCPLADDEGGNLDFTEGAPPGGELPAEAAADFGKRSLIDVEEPAAESDTEEEVGRECAFCGLWVRDGMAFFGYET